MHWKAFLTSSDKQIFALSGETQLKNTTGNNRFLCSVTSSSAQSAASDNTNPCPPPWGPFLDSPGNFSGPNLNIKNKSAGPR